MIVQETYKTTWLAKAPEHWKTSRIKNIFAEIDDRSETGEEELLSVSHYTGVTKKRDRLENETDFISNAKTLVGYKKVAENDLVSNIMLAWNGSLGISKYNGITSPAYCVYRIKGDNNPNYFGYLFSTAFMKAEFRKKSFGIIDSRLRLYSDKFFSIPAPVPPKTEQDQIVTYIKEQSKKIKHFIKKKQTFIVLLKEQRQAIINKVVTKGVNPNVTLKHSGIEWLGDIPETWNLRKLKFCVSLNSNSIPSESDNKIYLKVALENIDNWTGKYIETETPDFEAQGNFFKEGDVLFNKLRPYLAKAYLANEKGFSVGELLVFTPNKNYFTSDFLFQRLMTTDFIEIVNSSTYGAKMPRASWSFIGNLKLPIPPKDEQTQIVSRIKTDTAKIDQAITQAQKEIALIKEYKEAMIAEAVLGKFNHKTVKS